MKSRRKLVWWVVGIAGFLLALPFLLQLNGILPWSPINCWHYDVDINSGRIRYTRYFAFIMVSQHTEESALSRTLLPEDIKDSQPDWRRVFTFSPFYHNSPHYTFHSAINQIKQLETTWQIGKLTPAARRLSAKRVLELWQEGQSYHIADTYLHALSDIAFRSDAENKITDEKDLPTIH